MGGDAAHKKLLKEWVPHAFRPVGNGKRDAEHFDPMFHVPNGYVMFNDYLIFFTPLVQGTRGKRTFTPREVFDHFWSHVEQHLCNENTTCGTYIMCVDDKRNVPSAKATTQHKRIAVAEKTAERKRQEEGEEEEKEEDQFYPAGCTLVEEGVQFPDGHVERIDLYRLTRSCHHTHGKMKGDAAQRSNLRNDLWKMFLPYIDLEVQISLPRGRSFVFDFDHVGPWHFVKGKPPKQVIVFAHCLGEADLAAIVWMHRFRRTPSRGSRRPACAMDFHIDSSDGDLNALFLRYSEFPVPPHATGKVYWHCDPGELVCDLHDLRDGLSGTDSSPFESPQHAVLSFIYSGMDYKFKEYYAAGFGCDKICTAVKRVKPSAIQRKFKELCKLQADTPAWNSYYVSRLKALGGVHVDFLNPSERLCSKPRHWIHMYEEAFLLELYDTKSGRVQVAGVPPVSVQDLSIPKMRKYIELRKLVSLKFPSDEEVMYQAEWTQWIWEYWGNARLGIKAPPKPMITEALDDERRQNKAREDARKKESKDKALAKKTAAAAGIPTPKQTRVAKHKAVASPSPVPVAVKMEVDEVTVREDPAVITLGDARVSIYIAKPMEFVQRAKRNKVSPYMQFRSQVRNEAEARELGVGSTPSAREEQEFNQGMGSALAAVGFFDRSIFHPAVKQEEDVEMKF